ncbi:hypothetical protein PIROE2DRAFT_58775 [Piromyces sp. E2]|nr:hypothetical protein PIROE2DRAFT_58775 [Piromyces sp. E2]|eukprot:OUM67479.1 hypothetical protein PIROE2DRAFT_58775 [Piromyces sp. E2]
MESNFLKTSEFDTIYNELPETGISTGKFAACTADPNFQKIFYPHFKRINLINCHYLEEEEEEEKGKGKGKGKEKNNISNRSTCVPELFSTEDFSGPAALKLAQSGKKVAVLIFADSTNVGGIYMTGYSPAGTQEEQTVLMAPEIYGYLGEKYGVHDIGGDGDGCYKANQKRYCLNKDEYEKPEVINPAYGYILTNLLMTHNVQGRSSMEKLLKDKVVEVSYAFLSMPSFASGVSRDPIGAVLIGQREEKDGEKIYQDIDDAYSSLYNSLSLYSDGIKQKIGKIGIFCSEKRLQDFSEKYMGKKDCGGIADIICTIVRVNAMLEVDKNAKKKLVKELNLDSFTSFEKEVKGILKEAQDHYEECILRKFTHLIKGTEKAGADTLVLGKIGCGAFLNDENEISKFMGKAIAKSKYIKQIYFAGMSEGDPFLKKVKKAMEKK